MAGKNSAKSKWIEPRMVLTPPFVAAFPDLFETTLNDLNGKMECRVTALFPKDADLSELKRTIDAAAKDKWPSGLPPKSKTPLRDQAEFGKVNDETGQYELYAGATPGAMFMRLRTEEVPQIVDVARNEVTDPDRVYPGVWMRAKIRVFPFDSKGNKGVTTLIESLQLLGDGEKLVKGRKRTNAADDFPVIPDEEAAKYMAASNF